MNPYWKLVNSGLTFILGGIVGVAYRDNLRR